MDQCIFCKILNKEIPANPVYEDDSTIIIKDISPQAPFHYLAIPKKHFAGIHEVPSAEMELLPKLFAAISKVVEKESLDKKGYRLVINFGENAGQTVPHIHVHILAGRNLAWPPG